MRKISVVLGLSALLALLVATTASAYTKCKTYNDGCTICDFYAPDGTPQGWIEWCH